MSECEVSGVCGSRVCSEVKVSGVFDSRVWSECKVSSVYDSRVLAECKVSVFLTLDFGRSGIFLVFEVVDSARSV